MRIFISWLEIILDIDYIQISPTDGCQIVEEKMICYANPVYHGTTDLEMAVDYCQDICNEDE